MLLPARETLVSPVILTQGTPIHSPSQVVVIPLKGQVSSAMSIWPNLWRYSARVRVLSAMMSRSEGMPYDSSRARIVPAASADATLTSSLEPGADSLTRAQSIAHGSLTLMILLSDPNVT